MNIIKQLAGNYKKIAIVGMAKNSGKTTSLNFLIEKAMDEDILVGVTSTGRDGESIDLVTGTNKPKVFLDVGTIVTVAVQIYELSEAGLEILKITEYPTVLGPLMICRVAESGYVQVAGPVNTSDHEKVCEEMLDLGCQLILIDGAVDRRAIAAPETSDAIILATGAVISRNMDKVIEETLHVLNLYGLPALEEGMHRRNLLEASPQEKIVLLGEKLGDKKLKVLDLETGLMASSLLDQAIDEKVELVYLPGALTLSVLADIHPRKLSDLTFVLKDSTKIFIGAKEWQQLIKKGLEVKVLDNIEVAAVTVNPYAPSGYSFDHRDFLESMQAAVGETPVIDVRFASNSGLC